MWTPETKDALIIYGTRAVPEIVNACDRLGRMGANVLRLEQALHSDTYLLEDTYQAVVKQITRWFGVPVMS